MHKPESKSWLADVFVSANWCMNIACTTCGCGPLKRAVWTAAAKQAGVNASFEKTPLYDFFSGISRDDCRKLVRTLSVGLRELPPMEWHESNACMVILYDLDRRGLLLSGLSGTPAGELLEQMVEHSRRIQEQWEKRQEYEGPLAVEKRKRAKQEARAIAHASRQVETLRQNAVRLEWIASVADLPPAMRLSRFATDSAIKLEGVPVELIPTQESDLIGFSQADADALVTRIDRRRSGPWGHLRRMLIARKVAGA